MAFDGIFLKGITKEIKDNILLSKADKIHQPSKDEIIISFRGGKKPCKLLLSANASYPRVHFTSKPEDNPPSPPMFCMLLRKHLAGARLIDVIQPKCERILFLEFEGTNELFDIVKKTLVIEIMGRYSNIILLEDNKIIDSIKHVDFETSSQRQILPGLKYELPPAQNKYDLCDDIDITTIFQNINSEEKADKFILNTFMGLSPVICRELCYLSCKNSTPRFCEMEKSEIEKLIFHTKILRENIIKGNFSPSMIIEKEGKLVDITFMDINQYTGKCFSKEYETFSSLCDDFYSKKATFEKIRQKGNDLLKLLTVHIERQKRKEAAISQDILNCENSDNLRIFGELITSNIYKIQKGMQEVEVENYYDNNTPVTIPLDYNKTPSQNAQKYFKEYQKTKTAKEYLSKQLELCKREIIYLESVFDNLSNAENEKDLSDIREELSQNGYSKSKTKNGKMQKSIPMEFCSSDGFKILAGKNNIQNDYIISKQSPRDIWFHAQKMPSSHVIIISNGEDIPLKTLEEAAIICATHSKARGSTKITVDYCPLRFVKKIPGAKPGLVTYSNFESAVVDSNDNLCDKLRIK